MSKTFRLEAVVLKRNNFGDADRFVTLFSKEQGKISAVAKGVRKIKSKKRAVLEPGNRIQIMLVTTKSSPIITEAVLLDSYNGAKGNLPRLTQLYQLLEIIDHLTVEDEFHPDVYDLLTSSLSALEQNGSKKTMLLENIRLILKDLGFTHDKKFSEVSLREYIETIAEKKLKTKDFLTHHS